MCRHRKLKRAFASLPAAAVLAAGLLVAPPAAPPAAAVAGKPLGQCATNDDRGPRCVEVSAKLNRAPATAQEATLSVTIHAHIDVPATRIEIDLPAALRFVAVPDEFSTQQGEPAVRVMDLARGRKAFTAKVVAVAPADVAVRVRALPPAGYGLGIEEPVLATIGADAKSSYLGLPPGPYATAPVAADVRATALTPLPAPNVGTAGLPKPHSDDAPANPSVAAISCVRGGFFYVDPAGATRPSVNLQVQVWDEDPANSDDLLTVGLTDGAGQYRLCFDNGSDARGGQDVYLIFVTQNGQWGVEWDDDPYDFRTGIRENIGDGTTVDFGGLQPADARLRGSLRAFDDANAAAAFTPGDCWDSFDHDCRRIDINWNPDENPRTAYDPGSNEVSLLAQDADDRNVVVHEIGHAVMDDVYDDNTVDPGNQCGDHQLHLRESQECAWVEGFADWYGVAVFGDPVYRDTVDQTVEQSFDTPTWGSVRQDTGAAWENGDGVEGRIAGAMWDLVDGPGEAPWDRYGDGLDGVWDTFLRNRSTTFNQYWIQRGQNGRNVGPDALAVLFQNTIDYGFRDPLADHRSLTRPTPIVDHNYRFDTTRIFWSVVTLRPPAAADYDLRVYDDSNLSQLLESSLALTGVIDFVAINSNRRPLGDYYPQVHAVSGTGDYAIEGDETEGLFAGTATVAMAPDRLAAVWDVCLLTAQRVTFTVTPSDAGQDAELFVVSSDTPGGDTVVSRFEALERASANGPGQPETLTADLAEGCQGVIVVNRAGNGTYTLTQS